MTKLGRILVIGSALTTLVLAGGTTVAAKTSTLGSPTGSTATPAGYKLVHTAFLTVPNNSQAFGRATCPRTATGAIRRPQSGGVFITSPSLYANVNSSYPDADGVSWDAYVNNFSGASTTFEVWAVCARPRTGYIRVETSGLFNPNGSQNSFLQVCPTGKKILGGGAYLTSGGYANINSSYPAANGWLIDANNASGVDETFDVFAICSSYPSTTHYGIHAGSPVDNAPNTQSPASISCPSGQSSLGGGVFSSSGSTSVNINVTQPVTGGWVNWMNNATSSDQSIQPYVICAT
jgi:hypothetical protein